MKRILVNLLIIAALLSVCACSSSPKVLPSTNTFEPIVFSGSDSQKTPPFTIPTKEWIIDWSYTTSGSPPILFSVMVYPRGKTPEKGDTYAEAIIYPQKTSGTTYSYAGPGDYYLVVGAYDIEEWVVTIRPPYTTS